MLSLLFIAIVFRLNLKQQKRCGRLFPMTMGGKNSANYGNQLDYHAETGQLAMAADTLDQLFAGSETSFMKKRGFIALLKEPSMDIVWIKTVSLECSMHGLTFSADGLLVLSHTAEASSHFIFIFDALDGTLKKSFSCA